MKIEIAPDEIKVLQDLRKWIQGQQGQPYQHEFNKKADGWLCVVESILYRVNKQEVGK